MWNDPIVDEVRKYRDKHASRFNYDLHLIYEDLKKSEKKRGRKLISFEDVKKKSKSVKKLIPFDL